MRLPLWVAGWSMECLMPGKRILTGAVALLLAVSFAAPSSARALSADGFEYTVTGSAATVTGCTSTCPTALVIPDALGGYSVTSIADHAFEGNLLATVSIPDSVETIGVSAFYDNSLTSAIIPNSVTSIGNYAFESNNLTSVTFLGNAPTAGDYVFVGNLDLSSVTRSSTATGWGSTWSGVPVVTDELPPQTTLDVTPNSTTSSLVASFEFSGSDDRSPVTFECSVDGESYVSCASPFSTPTLSVGPHMFAVRAVDAVGNIDLTPASCTWTIESGLPPTNRDGSLWTTTLVILAGLTAAASIGLRVRGAKRT
jgi:hypothetical protein